MHNAAPRMTRRLNDSTRVRRGPRSVCAIAVRRKCWSRRTATPMPRKTPHTKNAAANSLALSHGCLRLRLTTSATSTIVKPSSSSAHTTIRRRSSGSSTGHLRWRAARTVMRGLTALAVTLLDGADLAEELDGVGAELLSLRILQRLRQHHEALLVDLRVEFHAELLQRLYRGGVELEGLARRERARVLRGLDDPPALLLGETVPRLLAHPQMVAVGLVLGPIDNGRGLVVLVLEHDVVAVLRDLHEPRLQRRVHLAERHVDRHRLVRAEERVFRLGGLHAHLLARDVADVADGELGVHVAKTERHETQRARAGGVLEDHLLERLVDALVVHRVRQMRLV